MSKKSRYTGQWTRWWFQLMILVHVDQQHSLGATQSNDIFLHGIDMYLHMEEASKLSDTLWYILNIIDICVFTIIINYICTYVPIWTHIHPPATILRKIPRKLVPRNMKHAALCLTGIGLLFGRLIALITPLQGSWPMLSAKVIVRILRYRW